MARTITTTKRKRGIFGTIVWWLFLAFNALMAFWMFGLWSTVGQQNDLTDGSAESAGAVIGGTLASGMILTIWIIGALILGLIVALTRGKTVTVQETVD